MQQTSEYHEHACVAEQLLRVIPRCPAVTIPYSPSVKKVTAQQVLSSPVHPLACGWVGQSRAYAWFDAAFYVAMKNISLPGRGKPYQQWHGNTFSATEHYVLPDFPLCDAIHRKLSNSLPRCPPWFPSGIRDSFLPHPIHFIIYNHQHSIRFYIIIWSWKIIVESSRINQSLCPYSKRQLSKYFPTSNSVWISCFPHPGPMYCPLYPSFYLSNVTCVTAKIRASHMQVTYWCDVMVK
jgi:hypothetical protein